jgi:hypothetical protein
MHGPSARLPIAGSRAVEGAPGSQRRLVAAPRGRVLTTLREGLPDVAPMAPRAGAPRGRLVVVGWGLCATMVHPSRCLRKGAPARAARANLMFKTIFVVLEAFFVLCCLKRMQRATPVPSMPSCCEDRKNLPQAMDDIGRGTPTGHGGRVARSSRCARSRAVLLVFPERHWWLVMPVCDVGTDHKPRLLGGIMRRAGGQAQDQRRA